MPTRDRTVHFILRLCAGAALAVAAADSAEASDKPAVSFSSVGSEHLSGVDTQGWIFRVNQDESVVALGFWDRDADGLASSHLVGIWDGAGTLLRSATVATSSPLLGGFRYAGIDPLLLQAGSTYTIGAVQVGGSPDAVASRAGSLVSDPAVTFVRTVYGTGGGALVRPTLAQPELDPGYFGPSFLLAAPCTCNGYDPSRAGEWSFTGGAVFSRLRRHLSDAAFFGPGGRSPNSILLGSGLSSLTLGSFAGLHVFFTGWTPTLSYTDLERLSLVNLVRSGMNMVATLDDTNHNIADLFRVTLRNGGSDVQIAVMPEHPIFAGPFGRITRFRGGASKGHFVAWPDDAQLLATNDLGQATMLLIAPGTGGLPAGSGTVLLLADTDLLTTHERNLDPGTSTPDIPVTDAFALNLVAFLCNGWAPSAAPNLVFPQVANGAANISSLNVSNAGTTAAPFLWRFFDDAGRPLPLATGGGSVSTVAGSLQPNATAPSIVTDGKQGGAPQPVSGWAYVTGSPSLSGNVIFSVPGLGTTSVGASDLAGGFLVPIVKQPTASGPKDVFTGLAISNFSPGPATVRLEIWNMDGSVRSDGITTIVLPASGHSAKFLFQLFPAFDFSGFAGSLRVVSLDGMISAIGLQLGSGTGEFTVLPVRALYR